MYANTRLTTSAGSRSWGTLTAYFSGTQTHSAFAPQTVSTPTRSPILSLVHPAPSSSTTPTSSYPGVNGGFGPPRYVPARSWVSVNDAPEARTRTRASPAAGRGVSVSTRSRTSGPPNRVTTTRLTAVDATLAASTPPYEQTATRWLPLDSGNFNQKQAAMRTLIVAIV